MAVITQGCDETRYPSTRWPEPPRIVRPAGSVRLIDISATLHAVHFKLLQFCICPFASLRPARSVASHDAVLQTEYDIGTRNSVYLARLDILLGVLFTMLVFMQQRHVLEAVAGLERCSHFYYVEFTRKYVDWLIDVPQPGWSNQFR